MVPPGGVQGSSHAPSMHACPPMHGDTACTVIKRLPHSHAQRCEGGGTRCVPTPALIPPLATHAVGGRLPGARSRQACWFAAPPLFQWQPFISI